MLETKKIWHNGELVDWHNCKIHVLSHALHYGSAVFEGIRFYNTQQGPAIFRLKDHTKRLYKSCEALEFQIPFSEEEINKAVIETVRVNGLDSGYIRPLCFYGYGKMGINPNGASKDVIIAVWPWGAYLGEEAVAVKISKYIRIHPKSTVSTAKISGHYVNSILASLEAKHAGYNEALLLDYEGNIAEGPGENFFIVKDNQLHTPPLTNILEGITRNTIITIANSIGIETIEKTITPEEAKSADEAFFTGTAAEVTPIRKIDERVMSNGKSGPLTSKLRDIYLKIVRGEVEKYNNWLTYL